MCHPATSLVTVPDALAVQNPPFDLGMRKVLSSSGVYTLTKSGYCEEKGKQGMREDARQAISNAKTVS